MKVFSYLTCGIMVSLVACTTDTTSDKSDSTTDGDTSTAPLSAEGQWAEGYAEEMQAMVTVCAGMFFGMPAPRAASLATLDVFTS